MKAAFTALGWQPKDQPRSRIPCPAFGRFLIFFFFSLITVSYSIAAKRKGGCQQPHPVWRWLRRKFHHGLLVDKL